MNQNFKPDDVLAKWQEQPILLQHHESIELKVKLKLFHTSFFVDCQIRTETKKFVFQ
jgi:hypothetical protein